MDVRFGSRQRQATANAFVLVVLAAGALLVLLPLFWMLATALKTPEEISSSSSVWWPASPAWSNLGSALTVLPFFTYLRNTLVITGSCMVGELLSGSLVAYGFARLAFRGRDWLFIVLLATMMIPHQVTMIPTFVIFKYLGWLDTFLPLIVPSFLGGSAFSIILLRQYYLGIPQELLDSARIDGCNELQTWRNIILPLSIPALITCAVVSFTSHWNDFLGPLIYLHDPEKYTLSVGLATFGEGVDINLLMGANLFFMIPAIIVYFAAMKYIVIDLNLSGQ